MYLNVENDVRIYYEDYGDPDAFPLLLLHGWGVSSALWSEQIPFIVGEGYRVITIDSRGHGKSDNGKTSDSNLLEVIYNDIQVLLAHLDINEKFGIIGHSAGGGIAMSMYLSNPEDIAFLCILNSSYTLHERIDERIIWSLIPDMIKLGLNPIIRGPYKYLVRKLIPILAIILSKPKEKVKTWVEDILSVKRTILLEELKHIKKYNLKDKLDKIDIPCLIIAGEYDWLTPPSRSKVLHKHIPNSEFHIIKRTGHLSKIEKSDEVNKLILNFIKRFEKIK